MNALERITERVTRHGHPDAEDTSVYLLTIEEFFDGNDVVGSIGCNLYPMPKPADVRDVLERIRNMNSVVDMRVQITAFDDPDWPFSDTLWIVTNASEDEVASWFPPSLAPDEVWEGWQEDTEYEELGVPDGFRVVACWWD